MRYKYPCRFILVDKNLHINKNIFPIKGFKQHKCLGRYILYVEQSKDAHFIEKIENQAYFIIEGRFWDEIQKNDQFLPGLLNADEYVRIRLLKEINGFYSGIFYDVKSETCYLFADKHGFQRIYRTTDNKVFSNSLFTLVDLVGYKPDAIALFEHIILEYPIQNRTYFENIKLLPSLDVAKCAITEYREIFYPIKTGNTSTIERLEHAFDALYSKLASWSDGNIGISLSIGKDSRVLLYFLNKHKIPYDIFTFQYESTHMEYKIVQKIACFLGKQATLVPFDKIPNNELIAISGLPTFSNEFYRLGQFARQNNIDYLMLGYLGDHISGKLEYFRRFSINDFIKLSDAYFDCCRKGIQQISFERVADSFQEGYQIVKENCRRSFDKFSNYELPKAEIVHYLENRGSRRILSVMKYVAQNVNMILPVTESGIFHAYLNLPHNLINSQQAHTFLAAKDPSASAAHSIGLPIRIPLSMEKYIRKPVQILNKFKNLLPPKESTDPCVEVILTSDTIRSFLGKTKLKTTPKLSIRIKCLDEYYKYVETHFTQSGYLSQS